MAAIRPSALAYTKRISADEWAESAVILKDTGRFSYSVTPFFREPTRAASDLVNTCRVIMKTCAQVGKSQSILNILGWMSIYDPANSLIIMDSLKTGQRFSKNRLKPFLRDTCNISAYNKQAKDRSKETTNLSLGTGANLIIGSASSASDLCSTPVKWLFADELDRWCDELEGEGDPLLLAFKRQLRFMGMAVLTSTPTRPDGRIQQHYELGTQEVWSAICECGAYMRVSYDDISWDATPTYACPDCGQVYSERDIISLPHGYAPPKNSSAYKDKYGRIARSFEVTATLCHSQYTWDALKKEEMQARALGEAAIRSFRNTSLGETYTPPEQEVLNPSQLVRLAENFNESCLPDWVDSLFIGVDTQDRAFPYCIIGTSRDLARVAFVKASMILGDLRTAAPWAELKALFNSYRASTKDGRTLGITAVAIDSGGHFTQDIYALSMLSPRILAVKGRSHNPNFDEKSIIDRTTQVRVNAVGAGVGRCRLTFINTRFCKDIIYSHIYGKIHKTVIGSEWTWTNDPLSGINDDFFYQVTSEVKTYTNSGHYIYEKLPNRENHYLDCVVYALGAAEMFRLGRGAIPALHTEQVEHDVKKEDVEVEVEVSNPEPKVEHKEVLEKPVKPKAKIVLPVKSLKPAL